MQQAATQRRAIKLVAHWFEIAGKIVGAGSCERIGFDAYPQSNKPAAAAAQGYL
ncbi:MAG TPA: hypothetical protein VJ859_13825 [Allosphingosinicella sp.]|nr:hypothetical protein [Allosphingosinicella sp.]